MELAQARPARVLELFHRHRGVCQACPPAPVLVVASDCRCLPAVDRAAAVSASLVVFDDEVLLDGRVVLQRVHPLQACAGRACVIHRPSGHHMADWPLLWRDVRGLFERVCPCGTGHPDPDQVPFWREIGAEWMGVHGCCGCCRS